MPAKIRLEPNQPLTLKLVDPFADSSERYDSEMGICEYRTEDGRILALPRAAAIQLNSLSPAPGEEIGVCRQQSRIDIWLAPSSEKARAEAEAEPSDLAEQLAASIQQARNGKPAKEAVTPIRRKPAGKQDDQPRLFDRKPWPDPAIFPDFDRKGTGTDGPVALAALIPAASAPTHRDKPLPIPWNIAFREVSAWVSKELAGNNLQWSDAAQQDMVSTVLIAEEKAGRLTVWERGK